MTNIESASPLYREGLILMATPHISPTHPNERGKGLPVLSKLTPLLRRGISARFHREAGMAMLCTTLVSLYWHFPTPHVVPGLGNRDHEPAKRLFSSLNRVSASGIRELKLRNLKVPLEQES